MSDPKLKSNPPTQEFRALAAPAIANSKPFFVIKTNYNRRTVRRVRVTLASKTTNEDSIKSTQLAVRSVFSIYKASDFSTLVKSITAELPYDDNPEWNALIASSLPTLQKMAEKARRDLEEGHTVELDPDKL